MKIYTGIRNFCYQEQLLEEVSSLGAQCATYGPEENKTSTSITKLWIALN